MRKLTTKEAFELILEETGKSDYGLAHDIGVSPIMIGRYLRGESKLGKSKVELIKRLYQIEVTDARRPGRQRKLP